VRSKADVSLVYCTEPQKKLKSGKKEKLESTRDMLRSISKQSRKSTEKSGDVFYSSTVHNIDVELKLEIKLLKALKPWKM